MIQSRPTKDERLDRCPFCGAIPKWRITGDKDNENHYRVITVYCPICNAMRETGGNFMPTEDLENVAIAQWNKRTK